MSRIREIIKEQLKELPLRNFEVRLENEILDYLAQRFSVELLRTALNPSLSPEDSLRALWTDIKGDWKQRKESV